MKKIYNGEIAFRFYKGFERTNGELIPSRWEQMDYWDKHDINRLGADAVLKTNVPFIAKIQIITYSRGRSAANWSAILSDVDGCELEYAKLLEGMHVTIFMTDMLDIILKNNLFNGKSVFLRLAFCKRGMNYGLQQVDA